jgi:curved DNA-binding protein CbpA
MAKLKIQALLGNHYKTLGVSAFATTATIFYAWQDLRDRSRPDDVPLDQRSAVFKRIRAVNAAWYTLCDPDRRAAYDEQRRVANGGRSYDNPGEDPYDDVTSEFYDDPAGLPGRHQGSQHRQTLSAQQLAPVVPAKRKKSETESKSQSQKNEEEVAGKRQKLTEPEPRPGHAFQPAINTSDARAAKINSNAQHSQGDNIITAGNNHRLDPPESRNQSPETTNNAASATSGPPRTERIDHSERGVSVVRKCLTRILHNFNRAHKMANDLCDDAAHDALRRGRWIGLVRSLSKLLHKAKIMAQGDLVTLDDFAKGPLRSYSPDVAGIWLKNALSMAETRHRQVADLLSRLWAFGDAYNRLVSHGSHRLRKMADVLAMLDEVEAYARAMTGQQ